MREKRENFGYILILSLCYISLTSDTCSLPVTSTPYTRPPCQEPCNPWFAGDTWHLLACGGALRNLSGGVLHLDIYLGFVVVMLGNLATYKSHHHHYLNSSITKSNPKFQACSPTNSFG